MPRLCVFLIISIFLMLSVATVAIADIKFIVHPDAPVSDLSKDDIRKIFLGKKVTWDDGSSIHFVIMTGNIHEKFTRPYTRKTAVQFKNYWRRIMFTGMGSVPRKFKTQEELMQHVSITKGSIGYVSDECDLINVKTISIQ